LLLWFFVEFVLRKKASQKESPLIGIYERVVENGGFQQILEVTGVDCPEKNKCVWSVVVLRPGIGKKI
jgi:hypothetical protein